MTYKLKETAEAFEVVDGKLAGKKFKHGMQYDEIPDNEKSKFEVVKPKAAEKPVPARKKIAARSPEEKDTEHSGENA